MTDDCADLRFRLMLLRRGELDAVEAEAVRAHLATCPDCTTELEAERELDRRLREEASLGDAPTEWRRTVEAQLARERRPRWRRWSGGVLRTARRPLVAAALGAAAALLVVTSVNVLAPRQRPPDPLAVPLAEAASGYRRCALEQELGLSGPENLGKILMEMQQRLGVPTTTAFQGDADLALVHVDPTETMGRAGAIMVFRSRDGHVVT